MLQLPVRDRTIDALRGLAVVTMVAANAGAVILAEPHPLWFRIYETFAAPTFILLSAMMVVYTSEIGHRRFSYYLARGLLILSVGALLDALLWRIVPFMTVDVLYLIGLAMPLTYGFRRLGPWPRWVIVLALFALAPLLQAVLGYTDYPTEVGLWWNVPQEAQHPTGVLSHWLVDGWFPVFPWLGFSFLGVNLALLRPRRPEPRRFDRWPVAATAAVLAIGGAAVFAGFPGELLVRAGYSEMFYPPVIGYILCAVGVILFLFFLLDLRPGLRPLALLHPLGQAALAIYVLHEVLIVVLLGRLCAGLDMPSFALVYLATLVFLWLVAWSVRLLRERHPDLPLVARFLIGG